LIADLHTLSGQAGNALYALNERLVGRVQDDYLATGGGAQRVDCTRNEHPLVWHQRGLHRFARDSQRHNQPGNQPRMNNQGSDYDTDDDSYGNSHAIDLTRKVLRSQWLR
jgi:hypothetical protein